ncbi:MAG: hypothetical protein BroJett040_03290 [Oligoflexia bacterium]|nr:MAG: hypothetical protein BroJett040_03290 [Oligoflexia bacterium]
MKNAKYVLILMFALVGCSKVNFQNALQAENTKMAAPPDDYDDPMIPVTPEPPPVVVTPEPPVVTPEPPPVVVVPEPPPVVVPPPAPPAPQKTTGTCTKGQSVSSCLSCDYTVPTVPAWQPSTKAEKLAQIQYLSCPIKNASNSPTHTTITQLQAVSKIQACTQAIYPETSMYDSQALTIAALLGDDPYMRNKIYGGLWYQPPYTDHFEQYFGVYHADIIKVFCGGEDPATVLAGPMLTKEYYDLCYGLGQCDPSQWTSAARTRWNTIQAIRDQLRSCMITSRDLPPLTVLPGQPLPETLVKSCSWKKFDGLFEVGGQAEVQSWLDAGYKVSVETGVSCSQITSTAGLSGQVTLTGFICQ